MELPCDAEGKNIRQKKSERFPKWEGDTPTTLSSHPIVILRQRILRDAKDPNEGPMHLGRATKDSPLHMSDVNYAEVKYSIVKKDGAAAWAEAANVLEGLPIDFHSTTRALADSAADFKARFKLSLADAFAAALAREKKAELVTGDPEFKPLDQEIKIHWLR